MHSTTMENDSRELERVWKIVLVVEGSWSLMFVRVLL